VLSTAFVVIWKFFSLKMSKRNNELEDEGVSIIFERADNPLTTKLPKEQCKSLQDFLPGYAKT